MRSAAFVITQCRVQLSCTFVAFHLQFKQAHDIYRMITFLSQRKRGGAQGLGRQITCCFVSDVINSLHFPTAFSCVQPACRAGSNLAVLLQPLGMAFYTTVSHHCGSPLQLA